MTVDGRAGTADTDHGRRIDGQAEISDVLVAECRRLVEGLRRTETAPFLAAWPTSTTRVAAVPTMLEVVDWLGGAADTAPVFSAAFLALLHRLAPRLAWRQTYSAAEAGENFARNYGWTEILGPRGVALGTRIACGVLLLGPHTLYPSHSHEAEELYVPLSGTAEWRQAARPWVARPPGAVILHARHEPHAVRTGESALAALYLWRSDNLEQSARLDPNSALPTPSVGVATDWPRNGR